MKTDWTPKNLTLAGAGIISILIILPNLGKGWEAVKYLADAPPTAYAAKEKVEEVDSEFKEYLQAQREATIAQQATTEALKQYIGQQAPNQMAPHGLREYDATTDILWCCELTDRAACFSQDRWYRCP